MILVDFLSTLKTEKIKATIILNETEVCTIYTAGYDALDEIYKDMIIEKWEMVDRVSLKVFIKEAEPNEEPDDGQPEDNPSDNNPPADDQPSDDTTVHENQPTEGENE